VILVEKGFELWRSSYIFENLYKNT